MRVRPDCCSENCVRFSQPFPTLHVDLSFLYQQNLHFPTFGPRTHFSSQKLCISSRKLCTRPKTVYVFPHPPPLTSERGWSPAGGRTWIGCGRRPPARQIGELPGSPMPRPQWGLGDASRASTDAWEEGTAPRRGPQAYIVSLVGYTLDGTLPLTGYRPYRRGGSRQLGSGTRLVEEAGNPAKAVSGVRDPLTG